MSVSQQSWGEALAELFAYPRGPFTCMLQAARAALKQLQPAALAELDQFAQQMAELTEAEREELYTRTFDFDPSCALEIGWHLFGEDYNRGALLVRLRSELRQHGIEERGELPDHLSLVLPLLERMAPDAAAEFFACCVRPALSKLLEGLQKKGSPYQHALAAVLMLLQAKFGSEAREGANDARTVPLS